MINQNSQFFAILTNVGLAKQANADALGVPWKIAQMGIGDANDTDPVPSAAQTKLINEWRRAPLNSLKVDPTNSTIIIAEQVIPADIGGKWIREIALYDSDGDMVAVANCAPSFKPLLAQGSGRTQVVRLNMQVNNSGNVDLKIDPSVVLATRAYVDQKILEELNKQDFKFSAAVATTAPVVLSGLQTLDDAPGADGLRVLVWKQAQAKENGIYLMSPNAWARAPDADSSLEMTPGLFVHVERGTAYGDSLFQLVTDAPIVLGTTDLVFESPVGRTGVTAGTYRSVTVDKYGRVVGATNPTSLAAYGIDMASQAEAEAQSDQDNSKPMTALRVFQAIVKRVVQATETVFGWAKIATQAQTNSGADDTTIVTPKKLSTALGALIIQATEMIAGISKIATQALVNAGSDDATIVTPKKLRAGFSILLAQNGYIGLPFWLGGFMLQWGRVTLNDGGSQTVTLATAFPNAVWAAWTGMYANLSGDGGGVRSTAISSLTVSSVLVSYNDSFGSSGIPVGYWVLGN